MTDLWTGGAIGAGLFVGSGSALHTGGPASLVICFIIIGLMLLLVMQALAELGVLFPVNGAFFTYAVRFVDPSWGFACGWDYAIQWLTVLPFEITAAGITIAFWPEGAAVNIGVWITVFLVVLSAIQIFGVRGYGEVEFILSIIKVRHTGTRSDLGADRVRLDHCLQRLYHLRYHRQLRRRTDRRSRLHRRSLLA